MTMMLSTALLSASRNRGLRRLVVAAPVTRRVVERFVAGEDLTAALAAVRKLLNGGLFVTLDHLGEDISSVADTHATRDAAYASRMEGIVGTLAPGMAADLVVLAADPFATVPEELLTTEVLRTFVAGAERAQRGAGSSVLV